MDEQDHGQVPGAEPAPRWTHGAEPAPSAGSSADIASDRDAALLPDVPMVSRADGSADMGLPPPRPEPPAATGAGPAMLLAPGLAPATSSPPGIIRVAFLSALLSSILTLSGSLLLARSIWPETAILVPSPTAGLTASPSAIASAAPSPTAAPATPSPNVPEGASAVVTAAARVLPSVVTVNTQTAGRRGTISGTGSGFVFDARGWILTNRHVVSGVSSISVTLSDGRIVTGQAYGVSSGNDLAVVKVEATDLQAATIGSSAGLLLGQSVIVIGSPLGDYPGSVTTGVVSGLGRAIDISGVERLVNLVQTDAAVNPGNSGGPMVDLAGRVVGVAVATSAAQGISFGIPIDDARQVMVLALAGQPIP